MKYEYLEKKIRSTIIINTSKIFNLDLKKLFIYVPLLNVYIPTLLFMIYLVWIMIN